MHAQVSHSSVFLPGCNWASPERKLARQNFVLWEIAKKEYHEASERQLPRPKDPNEGALCGSPYQACDGIMALRNNKEVVMASPRPKLPCSSKSAFDPRGCKMERAESKRYYLLRPHALPAGELIDKNLYAIFKLPGTKLYCSVNATGSLQQKS